MYKTVFFLTRRPEFSHEEFQRQWRSRHLRLVAKLKGLKRIRGNVVWSDPGDLGFDAIGEFWWDSQDAFEEAVASPEGREVVADIESITSSHRHVAVTEHRVRVLR